MQRVRGLTGRTPGVQGKEDEVIADEEVKVVSSEDGRKVKLTRVSLVQLLDMSREKSRKMERSEGSEPKSEVKIFKRLFIADPRSDRRNIRGERKSGRNITGDSFKMAIKYSRLSWSYISKKWMKGGRKKSSNTKTKFREWQL